MAPSDSSGWSVVRVASYAGLAAVAGGLGLYAGGWLISQVQAERVRRIAQMLMDSEAALEQERVNRKAERIGRIRAEQKLRKLQLQTVLAGGEGAAADGGEEAEEAEDSGAASASGAAAAAAAGSAADASRGAKGSSRGRGKNGGQADRGASGAVDAATASVSRAGAGAGAAGAEGDARPMSATSGAAAPQLAVYPCRPVGYIHSCFTEKNGTPRQPLLVPLARCKVVLAHDIPQSALEGLTQYSHCWLLYVFHANTDMARSLTGDRSGLKAKIKVPRLNGGRMGVFATRSPHRPVPLGLSTAQVLEVRGRTLILGGADVVHGSPVLDIKPYVPFCDSLAGASAPAWVKVEAEDEPLSISAIVTPPQVEAALRASWRRVARGSLYRSEEEFLDLVQQALSRDIRSVHQRLNMPPTADPREALALALQGGASVAAPVVSRIVVGSVERPAAAPDTLRAAAAAAAAASGGAGGGGGGGAADGGGGGGGGGGAADGVGGAGESFDADASAGHQARKGEGEDGGEGEGAREGEGEGGDGSKEGHYHIVLESVFISYDVDSERRVLLRSARAEPYRARATAEGGQGAGGMHAAGTGAAADGADGEDE